MVPLVIQRYHGNEFVRGYSRFFQVIVPVCFLITKFLKYSKVKSELIFEESTSKYPKYKISAKSVRGFGSYEHLKCRPMHRLK